MHVEVVTPERVIFSGEASMVVTRTLDGEIAFQPNHAPFLGALVENHTRIYVEGDKVENLAVHGGFVEVSDNRVSILSDLAEFASEIDVEEARRQLEEAERKLLNGGSEDDDEEAQAAVRRANARISTVGG